MKASHQLMMIGARPAGQDKEDFYATPRVAIETLLSVEQFKGPIWEPACGNGAISTVLAEHGYPVVSTDLYDRGFGDTGVDFLQETVARAPNIVTNPPYSLGTQFAAKALSLASDKVAFLMRLAWLEGAKRRILFENSGLSRIHVFSRRLPRMHRHDYAGPKATSTMAFSWFVWDVTHEGPPNVYFL